MKSIRKIVGISAIVVLFLFGTNGVSACYKDSPLYAGNNLDPEQSIGSVEAIHAGGSDILTVRYTTTGDWIITETNLLVTTSLDKYITKSGNPKVGHFHKTSGSPTMVTDTEVVYTLDLNEIFENGIGGRLYIAAHAVVQHPIYGEETAWADTGFSFQETFGGNSWALYFIIDI